MIEYIIGFIIVAYILFVIVGLIFITYGVFNLGTETVPKNEANLVAIAYVNSKPTGINYTEDMRKADATAESAKPTTAEYTAAKKNAEIAKINAKPLTNGYTEEMRQLELKSVPELTVEVPNGKLNMTLSSLQLMIGKITLISMWVFVIIGIVFAIFSSMD